MRRTDLGGQRGAAQQKWMIGRHGLASVHPKGELYRLDSRAAASLENNHV